MEKKIIFLLGVSPYLYPIEKHIFGLYSFLYDHRSKTLHAHEKGKIIPINFPNGNEK
jgi:hypothetical protein